MDPDLAFFLFCADLSDKPLRARPHCVGRIALALAFPSPGWADRCFPALSMNAGYSRLFAQAALAALRSCCGAQARFDALAWNGAYGGSSTRCSIQMGLGRPFRVGEADKLAAAILAAATGSMASFGAPCLATCEMLGPGESSDASAASDACRGSLAAAELICSPALRLLSMASKASIGMAIASPAGPSKPARL